MEAAVRQRLDLAEAMLRERTLLSDMERIRQEVMDELKIVLTQIPYVGGGRQKGTWLSGESVPPMGKFGLQQNSPVTDHTARAD
jgi:hypothetical protein